MSRNLLILAEYGEREVCTNQCGSGEFVGG